MAEQHLSIFELALGTTSFYALPDAIRAVHDRRVAKKFSGFATVRRSQGMFGSLIGWVFGLPQASEGVPTTVSITRSSDGETWERRFGEQVLVSCLSLSRGGRPGRVTERFGVVSFDIDLDASLGRLYYPVGRARIGGIPLPRFLTPRSDTVEHLTGDDNRFYFSVKVEVPLIGHLITYEGWLLDVEDDRPALLHATLSR